MAEISFRDVQFVDQPVRVTIQVQTDVPSHLYGRLSATVPQIHPMQFTRRGVRLMSELRFCFVQYNDLEQEETGDTLTHTFICDNWPYCVTKWIYFYGTVSGVKSPSESCYIEHHNVYTAPSIITLGSPITSYTNSFSVNRPLEYTSMPVTGSGRLKRIEWWVQGSATDGKWIFHIGLNTIILNAVGVGRFSANIDIPVTAGQCMSVWAFYGSIKANNAAAGNMNCATYYYSNPWSSTPWPVFDRESYKNPIALYAEGVS